MHMDDIYIKYAKQIYYYLLYLSKDENLAEELTQETFYRAVKNINNFREECSIDVWLLTIAKNTFYNYLKKNKTMYNIESLTDDLVIDDIGGIEDKILLNQDKQQVYEVINKLNDFFKKIVLLRIEYDLTFKEIGHIVGKSENYVRVTYYRIKEKIKKEIKQGGMKNE